MGSVTFVTVRDGDDGWRPKGLWALVLRWIGLVQKTDLTEVRSPSTFVRLYTIYGSLVVFRL